LGACDGGEPRWKTELQGVPTMGVHRMKKVRSTLGQVGPHMMRDAGRDDAVGRLSGGTSFRWPRCRLDIRSSQLLRMSTAGKKSVTLHHPNPTPKVNVVVAFLQPEKTN